MKLRTQLLLPLIALSCFVGIYMHYVWFDQLTSNIVRLKDNDIHAHLTSVGEGLTPLLLGHQWANIYESLQALKKDNPDWLKIILTDNHHHQIYPLAEIEDQASGTPTTTTGKNSRQYTQIIHLAGRPLATIRLRVNNLPLMTEINTLKLHYDFALLFVIISTLLCILYIIQRSVIRPLEKINQASSRLSSGDYETPLPITGSNELVTLGKHFEAMRLALQHSVQALNDEIKHHKQTASQLEQAQRLAAVGSWEYDHLSRTLQCSNEIFHLFELAPDSSGVSPDIFFQYVHPDDRKRVEDYYHTNNVSTHATGINHRLQIQNGNIKHVFECIKVNYDKTGKPLFTVGAIQDISQRVDAELSLRHIQRMDVVGQMAGGIAHDFNNLLSIVIGNLDLITRSANTAKNPRRIASALAAANRGAQLTRKLLNLSRGTPQNPEPTNVNEIIQGMDDLIAKTLTPSIQLETHLADSIWTVLVDPGELENALLNLVINARDAMETKGSLITIETMNRNLEEDFSVLLKGQPPGDYVHIAVSDNGSGIKAELLDKIFDPFFSTKEKDRGAGLGMSMVYGFVERHGGYIKVYSELNIGTTVRIFLPRVDQIKKNQPIEADSVEKVNHKPLPTGTEKILIVDDEYALAEIALTYLQQAGYKVTCAENADHAQAILKQTSFDLVFSDIIMPGSMNGYELADWLEINYPDSRILLTSGYTAIAAEKNILQENKYPLIAKPYQRDELLIAIRKQLD